jgi:hypothetical protein
MQICLSFRREQDDCSPQDGVGVMQHVPWYQSGSLWVSLVAQTKPAESASDANVRNPSLLGQLKSLLETTIRTQNSGVNVYY